MATDTLHLSALDQRTVRVYTQTLLVFPFPDGNQAENALAALSNGLRKTLTQFPFLAGTLSLVNESGKLLLTYPTEIPDLSESGIFASKSIALCDDFNHTYEQLRRDGMPPSVFDPEIFRPVDLLKFAGVPPTGEGVVTFERSNAPVMRAQAVFIPGGLVLSMYFHHTVADCSGISK